MSPTDEMDLAFAGGTVCSRVGLLLPSARFREEKAELWE